MLDAFREKKLDVTLALRDLADIGKKVGAKSLAERIEKTLVQKLEEDRFHLVVVGEFNHGKSTFVNALIGQTTLATGVTPTTAAIHHLKYSNEPEATVVYTSGKRDPIPFDSVKGFAVGGGTSADDVDYIEVGYPAPLLKERILLVDTPGVNDLSLQRADITYSYIPRADAVLFLLDAGQILKESERQFLQEKLLKASRDKIVFVITKWDILSDDERKEALAYAKTQLAALVRDPIVFPVSSETALSGKPEESGMPELLAHLTRFLSEERGRILLDNALGEGVTVAELLDKGVEASRRARAMKQEELLRRIQMLEQDLKGQAGTIDDRRNKIRAEIGSIKMGARKDLERFVDDTIRQIPNVIDSAKRSELKQYLPSFLEETFKTWAENESREIASKLEDLAEKTIAMVREDQAETTKRVAAALGADLKRLEVHVDTFKYDAGIAALFAVGLGVLFVNVLVGGLLTVAAPILAFVLKDKIDDEYKARAKELAPGMIRQAAEKAAPKMDELIDEFAKKLDTWVVTAGEELHREVLEVLEAARDSRASGTPDDEKDIAAIETNASNLAKAKTRVTELRASLWAPKTPVEEPAEKVRVADAATTSPVAPAS